MRRILVAIQALVLAAGLCCAHSVEPAQAVLLKEVSFKGDLGLPLSELREYTEYLSNRPIEQSKLLKEVSFAVGQGLRHRGYLKEQLTPLIRSRKRSANSNDVEVAIELNIAAGKQYRIKEMTFTGLANELHQANLTQAFDIHQGDIADAEKIVAGVANLQVLFGRRGKEVAVIPNAVFDDADSTVSFQFVVQQ